MKRALSLLVAICCAFTLVACSKKEPEEPYTPPVQGGFYQETEPTVAPTTDAPMPTAPAVTEPPVTEPPVEETEPVEETTAPTEPQLTYIEEMRALHEGNEIYFKYNLQKIILYQLLHHI